MRRPTRTAILLLTLAVLAPPALRAGQPEGFDFYLHGLSQDGRSSINGTVVKKYASDFRFDIDIDDHGLILVTPSGFYVDPVVDIDVANPGDLWSSFVTDGADRYALRRDGVLRKNDRKLFELPDNGTAWMDLAVRDGRTYALRIDGLLVEDGVEIAFHPPGLYHFRQVRTDGTSVYCMRADGTVFRDDDRLPILEFRAGRLVDFDVTDGETLRTVWIALELDPTGTFLYGLRTDGAVYRGRVSGIEPLGLPVALLPFEPAQAPILAPVYFDLVFTTDGTWYAVTGDGHIYADDARREPLVDLPGDADRSGHLFTSLASLDDSFFAVRSDGRVYQDMDPDPVYDLPGHTYYGTVALSRRTPVLATKDGKKPVATVVKTKTVVGTPLLIPVVVTDVNNCPEDLVITPTELPPGAVWVPGISALAWDDPSPAGTYKFRFRVSDGVNSPDFAYTIAVQEPDPDPTRNRRPLRAKYKRAQLVVGQEYVLPVIADDPDGDPVTVRVNESQYPFTAGASFDPTTNTFRWTPSSDDQGRTRVKFKVSDGAAQRTIELTLKVKNGLFF